MRDLKIVENSIILNRTKWNIWKSVTQSVKKDKKKMRILKKYILAKLIKGMHWEDGTEAFANYNRCEND